MRMLLLAALIASFSAGTALACGWGKMAHSGNTTDEQVASAPANSSQPAKPAPTSQ